ncbi:hypothetical protein [Pseudomonas sp. GL-RE-19]|uniref:hypothetical protein n=1 Tax=Pseudomonas sp. GL-RE-19 TaxID=2832389 RepID=UPI001CBF3D34|nr:hypothetical protein [Pseudomonas sp. GL-RE-19]
MKDITGITEIAGTTDQTGALEGTVEPLFWPAPNVTQPRHYDTVQRGFLIKADAWAGVSPIHKWNVFISFPGRDRALHYKPAFSSYFVGGVAYSQMQFNVPVNAVPRTDDFYLEIEYQATAYSDSRWVYYLKMQGLTKPSITNPGTVGVARPTISGTGVQDSTVKLYQANSGTILFASTTVQPDGTWRVTLNQPLWMADPFRLTASQTLNGETSEWANIVSFAVLFTPVITTVTASADGKPAISGTGGLAGAILQIWMDGGAGGVRLSTTVRPDGSWSVAAATAWAAGTHRITARQIGQASGANSDWAPVKVFTIKPAPPVIDNPGFVKTPRPTISGTAAPYATVRLYQHGVGTTVFASATASSTGRWSVKLTHDLWMADPFALTAYQSLNGADSGWAHPVNFTVLFALEIENISVSADGKPMFSGKGGLMGAKVEVWRQGGAGGVLLTGTVQSNGRWTVTSSTAWAVGTHSVTTRQVGKNPQHKSDWAEHVSFIVKPGKPTIRALSGPVFASQVLTIERVHAGAVTLTLLDVDSGGTIAGKYSGTGSSRQFTPDQHWRLGTRRVKVLQAANGVSSVYSDVLAFNVVLVSALVHTPEENGFLELGGVFSGMRGWSGPGSRVVLYPLAGNNEVAAAEPQSNGNWTSTPLSLPPGAHTLRVLVKVGDQLSEAQARSFKIRPSRLVISPVSDPVEAKQALEITGVYSGAVTLRLLNADNSTVAGSFSGSGSRRSFTPTQDWLPGEHKVRAVQVVNSVESTPSLQLTFKARPFPPVINVPVEDSHLPADFQMSGTCSAGATVYLLRSDGNIVLPAQVAGNSWTVYYIWEMPGLTDVRAMQVVNSVDSYPTAFRRFYIKPPTPSIVPPPNPAAPRQTLSIVDVFTSGTVELRLLDDSNKEIAGDFAGVGATRLFTPRQNWPVGGSTVRLVQRVNEVDSDPSIPRVVCIQLLKLTILQPPPFGEPAQPLSIFGVHAAVQKLNMYSNGSLVPGSFSGEEAAYTFVPDQDWTPGTNTVQATQIVNELESEPSDPCTFSARPFAPAFDEPRNGASYPAGFEMSGSCRQGATIYLRNLDGTTLGCWMADGERWAATYIWDVPGFKQKRLTQVVNGIESKPGPVCDFYICPPSLTIIEPVGWIDPGFVLEITGVYSDAAVLKLFNYSKEVVGSFSGTGERRTFTPANNEWLPGNYSFTAVQEVNGAVSTPSPRVSMVVFPYPPVIDAPEEQSRQSADVQFSGTCHVGVRVYLLDKEGNTLVEGQVTGNTWMASYHWQEPGVTQVRGKQTLISNNASSLPGPLRVFYIKPATPSILPPPEPVTPRQPLTVTDVYPGAVTLTVFDEAGTPVAGSFTDAGSIRQFTPDRNWASENRLHVVQTVNDAASDPSEPCTFSVRLSAPVIEYPQHDQVIDIAQPFTGSAGRPGAGAFVQLHDPLNDDELAFTLPDINGHWKTPALPHGPGSHEVLARIYLDGLVSEDAHRAFKVRPPKPVIEPPASPIERLQPLIITGVYSALATLNVFDGAGRPVAGAVVGSGEDYAFTPDLEWAYGEHRISVTQVVEGVESVPSEVCVFTVEEEAIPEAPHFELPLSGSSTPSRPVVKVIGLPLAVFSVRIAQGEVLHSQAADADGVLEFAVVDRLLPGPVSLQVKQQADGPESEWSEPHGFIVQPQPKTPVINTPTPSSRVSTRPSFSGTGTTGGEIELRRTDDLVNLLVSIRGVSRWNWTATAPWAPGTYGVQARQVVRGDDSQWSPTRTFEVVSTRLEIAEVEPVLAQPVVKEHESVLLRMQVVTAETWEGHAGLEVRWLIDGKQEIQAITLTDEHGWAEYRYAPDTVGVHQILADVSHENEGGITNGAFEVTALAENAWMRDFALYLNGQQIDPGKGGLLMRRGMTHELELRINAASTVNGTTVTLDDLENAVSQGLLFTPDLGVPQTIGSDGLRWSITTLLGEEGYFGLKLSSPNLPDWHVPGHLMSDDLVDEVEVQFDTFANKAFGETLYPCHGARHSITLRPKPGSQIVGQDVTLEWLGDDAEEHNITLSPAGDVPQKMGLNGVTWTLDCSNSHGDALFALQLKIAKWGFTSRALPMSLAHNKAWFSETEGPKDMGGTAHYYMYGVRVTSVFTGQPVVNTQVTVVKTGYEGYTTTTSSTGWVYVFYNLGQSAYFKLINPYDGSSA